MKVQKLVMLYIFVVLASSIHAQKTIPEFAKFDSIAFAALEGNAPNALEVATKFKDACAKHPPSIYQVNAYTILGILNKDRGFYISALNHYLNALNTAEAISDDGRISACYNNIGMIYELQENYPRAKEYFQKSLRVEESLKKQNPLQKSIRLFNLGEVNLKQNSFDIALTYFNNSLQIEQGLKNDEGIMFALLGIAEVYIRIGRFTDAQISLENLAKHNNSDFPKVGVRYLALKGELYNKTGNFSEAIATINQAESLSKKYNLRVFLEEIYKYKISALKGLKDYVSLAGAYEKYNELLRELNNTKVKNQLEDLTYQNEINKKELELELISEERDLAQKSAVAERNIAQYESNIVWFLILGMVGFVLLVLFGIRKITR